MFCGYQKIHPYLSAGTITSSNSKAVSEIINHIGHKVKPTTRLKNQIHDLNKRYQSIVSFKILNLSSKLNLQMYISKSKVAFVAKLDSLHTKDII